MRHMLWIAGLVVAGAGVSAQSLAPGETAQAYASVRGWDVSTISESGKITACRALRGVGSDALIVSYDGGWQLTVPSGAVEGRLEARLGIDGVTDDRQVTVSGGFATLDLTEIERSAMMKGQAMTLQIGKGAVQDYALTGTTAALLKAQECYDSQTGQPATGPDMDEAITGAKVGMVYFDGGRLRQRVDGSWIEEGASGATQVYQEAGRDADSVTLKDADTGVTLRIDTRAMTVSEQQADGSWTVVHKATGLDQYISPRAG